MFSVEISNAVGFEMIYIYIYHINVSAVGKILKHKKGNIKCIMPI